MATLNILLIIALLAQVSLTFVLMIVAGRARFTAVKSKAVDIRQIALSQEGWPEDVRRRANCMNNQFETPILFYVLSILALVLNAVNAFFVIVAWGYIVSRILHAWVFIHSTDIMKRFRAFALGLLCLILQTVTLLIAVLSYMGS